MPNALRRKYQSYDDEMRSDWQPKDPTPQWLQNTLNIPHNVLAMGSNAMIDGYRGGKRMMTGQSTDPVADTMAALGAAGMASVAAPARAVALGARTRPASVFTAYHGSPHDFDKFSVDKIGTGEGAQAYGHGLYFAESPAVAKDYQAKLSPKTTAESQAQSLAEGMGRNWADMGGYERQQFIDEAVSQGYPEAAKVGGNLYEVNIKANKDDFLDFDTLIKEQPEHIRKVLDPIGENGDMPVAGPLMFDRRGSDGEVWTKRLKEAGVPGIKYKDAGSRGADGGTYNYVIFDDNLIEIAKKNGIPVKQTERGTEISERGMQMLGALQAAQATPPEQTFDRYEQF